RDAELGPGEHQRQLAGSGEGRDGGAAALGRGAFELRAPRRHERELGGDEEPVSDQQQDGDQECRQRVHDTSCPGAAASCPADGAATSPAGAGTSARDGAGTTGGPATSTGDGALIRILSATRRATLRTSSSTEPVSSSTVRR